MKHRQLFRSWRASSHSAVCCGIIRFQNGGPFHDRKLNCHRFNCWSNVPLYSHLNTNCRFRKLTFCSKFWYQTCLSSWICYAYKILWNSLSLANRKRRSHAGAEPFFSIFHRKNRNVKVFAICSIMYYTWEVCLLCGSSPANGLQSIGAR